MRYNLYNLYPLVTEPSVYSQCRSSCMSEIKVAFCWEVGLGGWGGGAEGGGGVERERQTDRDRDRDTERELENFILQE